jgi:hypothetical protein
MDAPIAPLVSGSFDPLLTYRHDPEHTISETGDSPPAGMPSRRV